MSTTTPDIVGQWKALKPEQRQKAMSRMTPEQKQRLATSLGFNGKPAGAPVDTIGPTPPSQHPVQDWLRHAETDVREGGSRTGVGRVLGKMQGRGDQGYTGLQAGVSRSAADFMGSPVLGAFETARGLTSLKEHPVKGAVDTVKGVAHMAEIPGMVMAGPEVEEAPAVIEAVRTGVGKVLEKLPTATRGAKRLNEVEEAAGELPVELQRTYEHLDQARKLSDSGATLPTPVKKLLKRLDNNQPFTYEEARRFYSNLSHLSAKDDMALTPSMRRQIGLIVNAMKDDIGDTAAQVDKAAVYYGGMKDYARAKKAARVGKILKDALASKTLRYAAGGAAGYGVAKAIGKELQ